MISYTQRHGESNTLAEALHNAFKERGLTVWLDVKMAKLNEGAMEEAVKNSRCVVAIISGGDGSDPNAYFNRSLCVQELRWAREVGTPIQPVVVAEDKKRIGVFLGQAPDDLKDLGRTDFIHLDRSRITYWEAGVKEVHQAIEELAAAAKAKAESAQSTSLLPAVPPVGSQGVSLQAAALSSQQPASVSPLDGLAERSSEGVCPQALLCPDDDLADDDAFINPNKLILPAALSRDDIGKTVKIVGDMLKVDGALRRVLWNGAEHSDCEGKIADVDATAKGQVALDGAVFQNPILIFSAEVRTCWMYVCVC